jgi:hypothetical protein
MASSIRTTIACAPELNLEDELPGNHAIVATTGPPILPDARHHPNAADRHGKQPTSVVSKKEVRNSGKKKRVAGELTSSGKKAKVEVDVIEKQRRRYLDGERPTCFVCLDLALVPVFMPCRCGQLIW